MLERKYGAKRQERKSRWTGRLLLVFILAIVWTIGLVQFSRNLPNNIEDESSHTDAIVVLTGGSQRLSVGFSLMAEGMADRLFISGVYRGVEVKQLLKNAQQSDEAHHWRIDIGDAVDTIGNAAETAVWAQREKVKSLRLVTAAYHMPRSLLEFRYHLPNVAIIPHPVFPKNVKIDKWWAWPGTARLIMSEYTKYLIAKLRHQLNDLI